jgi:hypothetical protein
MRYHGIFWVCWTWDNPQLQPIIHNYPHCFLYFNNFLMWDTLSSLDKPTNPRTFYKVRWQAEAAIGDSRYQLSVLDRTRNPCTAFPGCIRDIFGTIKKIAFHRCSSRSNWQNRRSDSPSAVTHQLGRWQMDDIPIHWLKFFVVCFLYAPVIHDCWPKKTVVARDISEFVTDCPFFHAGETTRIPWFGIYLWGRTRDKGM